MIALNARNSGQYAALIGNFEFKSFHLISFIFLVMYYSDEESHYCYWFSIKSLINFN